jgi:hypothetical protein
MEYFYEQKEKKCQGRDAVALSVAGGTVLRG